MSWIPRSLRLSLRVLIRRWAVTLASLLVIAVAVGASLVVLNILDDVLIRPLDFSRPEQLIRLWESNPAKGYSRFDVSPGTYVHWRDHSKAFSGLACFYVSGRDSVMRLGDQDIPLGTASVSPSFTQVLGMPPQLGKAFSRDPAGPSLLISRRLWQEAFQGDPQTAGRSVVLEGRSVEILGVMPAGFQMLQGVDAWRPLRLRQQMGLRERGTRYLQVIGRLRTGVTVEQAQAELEALSEQLAQSYPSTNLGWRPETLGLGESLTEDLRPAILTLAMAVALILLLACFNLANVFLARNAERGEELFVRSALGAGGLQLAGLLLSETLLLALGGGAVGLLLAYWATPLAAHYLGAADRVSGAGLQASILAPLLSLLLGTAIGLYPAYCAWRGAGANLATARTATPAGTAIRRLMSIFQVAAAVAVLAGAGLLLHSMGRMLSQDPGFQVGGLHVAEIRLPFDEMRRAGAAAPGIVAGLLDEVRSLAPVTEAEATSSLPLSGSRLMQFMSLPEKPQIERWPVGLTAVTDGYFRTMGIRRVAGRTFDGEDPQRPVAVVSASMAELLWPGESALGKRISIEADRAHSREVVGVVADVRSSSLASLGELEAYLPYVQFPVRFLSVLFRSQQPGTAPTLDELRGRIRRPSAGIGVFDFRTMQDVVDASWSETKLLTALITVLALISLSVALVGVYGVVRIRIRQRAPELAIRLALGATPTSLRRLVMREIALTAAAGISLGMAGTFLLSGLWRNLLFETSPNHPGVLLAVALLMLVAAVLSAYFPALSASRRDPSAILRAE